MLHSKSQQLKESSMPITAIEQALIDAARTYARKLHAFNTTGAIKDATHDTEWLQVQAAKYELIAAAVRLLPHAKPATPEQNNS
jgi:hypothetical protein